MMTAEIWLVLSALLLLLGIHPFVTYPLSLRLLPRPKARSTGSLVTEPAGDQSFAICVCAYNEEGTIERKMANMLALRRRLGGRLEILVYVDAATDRTAALLEPFRDEITLIVSPRRYGKVHGMNLLVERATASVIVFTDANVILQETAIEALGRAFDDPRVGCVCGHLIYVNAQDTPTAAVGSLYWRLEEHIKEYETAAGAVMGADGSIFALRRSLHRPVPLHLLDDMYLSLSVLCDGYRVVRAADAIAFEKSVTAPAEEFYRKIRIACQAFNVHRLLWPRIRRLSPSIVYMYVSHKLMRWLAIYSFFLSGIAAAAGLSALGVPYTATGVAAVALLGLLWWGGARGLTPFAQIREILIALLGAGIGVVKSYRGERFQTWTPASSIRGSLDRRS
jgi:cellulose synthase/poly-beta-1,6-N-acetylglucosamine synthase-like glycosyltransferase